MTACRWVEPAPVLDQALHLIRAADRAVSGEESLGAQVEQCLVDRFVVPSEYARGRGIIIADTKFEFGTDKDGRIILIDEVLTPVSSRFWPAASRSA